MLDPAQINREMSAAIQASAEKKLGRHLTPDEEYRIWNLGSFMGLEAVDRAIDVAKSPGELEDYLAGLPRGQPLPEEYTRQD